MSSLRRGNSMENDEVILAAVNPARYQRFANGAQPAFIAEQLSWNCGQVVRYVSREDTKPEIGLTPAESHMQNLKKALWHIKREIMLLGGNPDDVSVPDPRIKPEEPPLDEPGSHFRVKNPDDIGIEQYQCGGCGNKYQNDNLLDYHIKRENQITNERQILQQIMESPK